jgi:vancomycin resistance protein YoaR
MARWLFVLAFVLSVMLVGSLLTFELYYAERIYPGVHVWNVDVGGMRPAEAASSLPAGLGLDDPLITLHGAGHTWSVRATDLGLRLAPHASVAPAYRVGRGEDPVAHLRLLVEGTTLPPVAVYDQAVARRYLQALAEQIDHPPTDAQLILEGVTPTVKPSQPGRSLDVEATLAALAPLVSRLAPAQVDLVIHQVPPPVADAEPARAEAEALLAGPLTLMLPQPGEEDPGPWVLTPEQLVPMLVIEEREGALHTTLDQAALRGYLESIAPSLVVEPVDARFHFDEGSGQLTPITESRTGRALDVEASLAQVMAQLAQGNRYVPLVLRPVPPRYPDTATAQELGIIQLVAEGDSYFIGSPSGRDHNIRLAAGQFDGVVIPPDGTFSFNRYVGDVTAEQGYDESYVTAGEQLAIEVGGGICQVSTTVFRAAFWGGYPITERWAHNNRIGYYELRGAGVGMDATVYSPHVDFQFVNDSPYPLLIETEVEDAEHRLVFRFYSTDDGRRVEAEDVVVSDETEPGSPIYQLDEDLEPGSVIRWQSAVDGLTATIERRVYDAGGALKAHDTFVSTYDPRRAAYHHGPGYQPPAAGEEPETTE